MKAGEFFVELGVKGSEKTVGAITSVKSGMGELASMSLEAKAAILAAIYALERLMSSSAQTGAALTNFNALTGISAKTLQEYQYAASQVGISNDEMTASFKGIQNVMTAMRFGKGAPEGMAMLMGKLGGQFDPQRAKTDTEYVMRKLQEYANLEKDITKRNLVMKSFGLGEGVIAGMARNAFRPEILSKAPIFTDKETHQLDKVNAAFNNIGTSIKMAMGHFTAKHGLEMVQILQKIVTLSLQFVNALVTIGEKLGVFKGLGKGFDLFIIGINSAIKLIQELSAEFLKSKLFDQFQKLGEAVVKFAEHFKIFDKVLDFIKFIGNLSLTILKTVGGGLASLYGTEAEGLTHLLNSLSSEKKEGSTTSPTSEAQPKGLLSSLGLPSISDLIGPKTTNLNTQSSSSTQNNNINQTFHFAGDGKDHKQVGNETQRAITRAFYQIPQGGY